MATNPVLPPAFLPREKEGASVEKGISVHIRDRSAQVYAGESKADKGHCDLTNFGAATLHVGRMRDVGLEVSHDEIEPPHDLKHCNIEGIPEWTAEDDEARERAETIADMLSEQAYLAYSKLKK